MKKNLLKLNKCVIINLLEYIKINRQYTVFCKIGGVERKEQLMKKILMSVSAALTLAIAGQSVFAAAFTDISGEKYEWCAPQIEKMAAEGYVNGYEDGTYKPDSQVTKLEGISLFARAMGSTDETNKEVLELAHAQYDSALTSSGLDWGQDEIVYMMYKGALNAADLTTYINGATKNKPMTRGEAAVIITKAMGGEKKATSGNGVDLSYKDKNTIPSNILQYVQYVTDEGIMNGIDDEFKASGTVTRAQIAVMLDRVITKCDYSFYKGSFGGVDEEGEAITLNLIGKSETEYAMSDDIEYSIKGVAASLGDMEENLEVIAQFSGDKLVSVDALTEKPDEKLTVIYQGNSTLGTIQQIKVKDSANSSVRTYNCIPNVPVTYLGSPATIKSLKSGDSMVITVADGVVTSISVENTTTTIKNATVTSLEINDDDGVLYIGISSTDSEYDGDIYPVADEPVVMKNSKESDMSKIYVGDKVTLTIRYGRVSKVEATSTLNTATGTLVSLTISDQPTMVLRVDGKDKTYQIPQNCEIYVNQEEATLYDFRVGDSLVVTTNSSAVTKIQCSTSVITTSGKVGGVVTAVNTSYGFLSVQTEGSDIPVTVFCRDNTSTFIDDAGKTLKMNKITVGDMVECRGTTTNGAFAATLIIVTKAS